MTLLDIIWPWAALKREREAKWSVIGECNDARRNEQVVLAEYEDLARSYERQCIEANRLRFRVECFEECIRTGRLVGRDPKTGRMMKRGVL